MNYSFNSRVRYSETGENGKLTLPGVLNYFQDCCTFHAESVGLGGDVLKARDRAWVLSSWQVIVDEYPAMGTEIRITTAPYDFKGFMGMRNFTIETMDGKKLAWANSNWTHLAISTGVPARLTPADTDNYILGEKLEMDYAPRKIKLPDDMTSQESFTVQKHHLDTNHHVNNCQYICMAEDFLPEEAAWLDGMARTAGWRERTKRRGGMKTERGVAGNKKNREAGASLFFLLTVRIISCPRWSCASP